MRGYIITGIVIGSLLAIGQVNQLSKPAEHRIGAEVYITSDDSYHLFRVSGQPVKKPLFPVFGEKGHVSHSQGDDCRVEFRQFLEPPVIEIVEVDVPCSKLSFNKPGVEVSETTAAKPAPRKTFMDEDGNVFIAEEEGGAHGASDCEASLDINAVKPVCE